MFEGQPAVVTLVHDAGVLGGVEPVRHLVGPPPTDVREQQRRVLAAQCRGHQEHLAGGVRKVLEAPGDHGLHRLGHLTAPGPGGRRQPGQLDEEEGVASGTGAPVVDPPGVGLGADDGGDQGARVALSETTELEGARPVAGQGHPEVGEGPGGLRAGAAGSHQGHPVAGAAGWSPGG